MCDLCRPEKAVHERGKRHWAALAFTHLSSILLYSLSSYLIRAENIYLCDPY